MHDHHDGQRQEPADESGSGRPGSGPRHRSTRWIRRRGPVRATSAGLISRSAARIVASQPTTQKAPTAPMTRNGMPPALGRGAGQEQDHDRRRDRAQRRPALEDAVAQRPVAAREQALRGHQRAGPVPGLEEPQQDPAGEELAVAGDPAGREADGRPAQEHRRVEPSRTDPVGQQPRDDPAHRERQAEAQLEPAVILVVQMQRGG